MKGARPNSRKLTLGDVAKASGFSPSTVSIVLNEAPLSRFVAAQTKQKIRETAERLDYRPDIFARSLRSRRSHTVGVLVVDLADPFCTLILQGIERKLMQTPYLPIIMDAHNQPSQVERYVKMMLERRVEGLITVANWLLFDMAILEQVSDHGLPNFVVGRGFQSPRISSVSADNEAGGYAAMRHLYELGHREIAFIRGPRRLADTRFRWKGVRRFAQESHLRLRSKLTQSLPETSDFMSSFESSRRLTAAMLESGERFTALLAFDDISAYGAIRALTEAGRQVPGQCSVIGFDDIPAAALSSPGLTTVRQPMLEMGEYAADYILRSLELPSLESRSLESRSLEVQSREPGSRAKEGSCELNHLMAAELVIRGSTAAPSRQGHGVSGMR